MAAAPCPFDSFDPSKDYFPTKVSLRHADKIRIEYHNSYIRLHFQTSLTTGFSALLVLCHAPIPGGDIGNMIIRIPIPGNATLSIGSSESDYQMIGFLEKLGLASQINSVPDTRQVTSPCLQKSISEGKVQSNSNSSDLILGTSERLHLPFTEAMLLESEPLGRAEYIVPLSILFGKEALGQAVFNESASLYECHQLAFKKITSELRPRVAWVRSIENGYDMPDLLYHETLVSHAGGFQTPNPLSHSPEYLFGSVDIVIDETRQVFGLEHFRRAYQIPAGSTVSAVNPLTGRVYKPDLLRNEEGAWDWRVHAWAQPEAALAEVIHILHPSFNTSFSPKWFRRLQEDASFPVVVVKLDECQEGVFPPRALVCPPGWTVPLNRLPGSGTHFATPEPMQLGLLMGFGICIGLILTVFSIGWVLSVCCSLGSWRKSFRKKESPLSEKCDNGHGMDGKDDDDDWVPLDLFSPRSTTSSSSEGTVF